MESWYSRSELFEEVCSVKHYHFFGRLKQTDSFWAKRSRQQSLKHFKEIDYKLNNEINHFYVRIINDNIEWVQTHDRNDENSDSTISWFSNFIMGQSCCKYLVQNVFFYSDLTSFSVLEFNEVYERKWFFRKQAADLVQIAWASLGVACLHLSEYLLCTETSFTCIDF